MGIGAGLYMCDIVIKKSTFAISSPDEFLVNCCLTKLFVNFSIKIILKTALVMPSSVNRHCANSINTLSFNN